MTPPPKLVLAYVDSLRADMLERAVAEGRAPTFARLLERGTYIPDCVSSFPSVTPVACAEMVTGRGAEEHWISGMNWYHRLERRYVDYGSSLEASRAFGVFRTLYDLVYNLNLAHLNPGIETVFETLDDAKLRTACTPYLIYRGRHRHRVTLEGLTRRAIDISGLDLNNHTWGPRELFYGDLYSSRPVPCRSSSIPGSRDGYSACCAAELAGADLYDFLLLSLPDNDHYSHRHGPEASVESIAKADHCFTKLVTAAGGLDGFLADHALILLADHAHSAVEREEDLAARLGERWRVLAPSEDSPEQAQLAVSPTGRAAHVYRIGPAAPDHAELRAALGEMDGVDICCWVADGEGAAVERPTPGLPDTELWATVTGPAGECAFRPADGPPGSAIVVRDRRGREWLLRGDPAALAAEVVPGDAVDAAGPAGANGSTGAAGAGAAAEFAGAEYPDALGRVWSALSNPNAGDVLVSATPGYEFVDWGGASHLGGGSHGSLRREDSLGPLLFVGCGPTAPDDRAQWSLRDIVPAIHDHFGVTP